MTFFSWNCKGLSNISSLINQFICNIASSFNLDFIFLCETKCSVASLEPIFLNFGFIGCAGVDVEDNNGGLFLCWSKRIAVSVTYFSKNVIVCKAFEPSNNNYNVAFVYGLPYVKNRQQVWHQLTNYIDSSKGDWFIFRRF